MSESDKLFSKTVSGGYIKANSVSVLYARDALCVATASADIVGDHWWISRVKVHELARRQGLGRAALLDLLALLRTKKGPRKVVVAPGGYGSDPEELSLFYQSCGFEPVSSGELHLYLD